MFIPGILISIATFPGVIVHEFAHQLFCRWFRIPVYEVCYFRLDNPVGYVIHEAPQEAWKQVFISVGPFFVNTILGALIALPASTAFFVLDNPNLLDYILVYLGVSIAMHSFPSIGDAKSMWSAISGVEGNSLLKIIITPVAGLIYLGALGSFFWLDLLYGIGVVMGLSKLIIILMS